jgi:hypothetical protein
MRRSTRGKGADVTRQGISFVFYLRRGAAYEDAVSMMETFLVVYRVVWRWHW